MKRIFGVINNNLQAEENKLRLRRFQKIIGNYYPYLYYQIGDRCLIGEYTQSSISGITNDGDLSLIFQGNLFEKSKNISDETHIKNLYKKYGAAFLPHLNGSYNFCLLDKRKRYLYIVSDKYASRPLYWYFSNGQFLFASEVKIILQLLKKKPSIDWAGWGQYLTFRFPLGNNTFYNGINLIEPATVFQFDLQKSLLTYSKKHYWSYSKISIDHSKAEESRIKEGVLVFKKVFSKLGEQLENKKTIVMLSGGYDSRGISAGLSFFSKKREFDTLTTLHPSGPSEKNIARKVAEKIGVKNYHVKRGNDIYKKYYILKSFLTDSLVQEHLWVMPMLKKIKQYDVCLDGNAGDILLRGTRIRPIHIKENKNVSLLAKLFKKQFGFDYDWLKKYMDPQIWRQIKYNQGWAEDCFTKIDATENRFSIFLMMYRIRNSVSLSPNNIISSAVKEVVQPYFDDIFVKFSLSLPYTYKFTGIYRKILDRAFPQLKNIESVSDIDPEKLAEYDKRIVHFDDNSRELISDFLPVSKQDYEFLLGELKRMKAPPFVNKRKFLNDIGIDPKLNRLATIMDITLWFNLFQK